MRVLIVGGGSAGWMTAALIDAILNTATVKPVKIALVESARIGRIGVGEATIPTMKRTLARIGVPEREFLREADATFKQGIQFVNWGTPDHTYYHPFDRISLIKHDLYGLRWLASDRSIPFANTVSAQPSFCDRELSPKTLENKDYEGVLSYAYHMDAEKFADFLRDRSKLRGVQHLIDEVVDVEMTTRGEILAVRTETGQRLEADLFIDCSGFARILISKAMGADFESYGDWLMCDRAVAMRVPYETRPFVNIRPFTTSTARTAGWIWDIGLRDRRGVGYVYSSQFISDDEAEAELRSFEGPHCADIPARRLRFQSGRIATPWLGNCVAIGLSGGFLEPLESTGLFLIEEGVEYLCELFPRTGRMEAASKLYNRKMRDRYEECVDFINLHYCLTRRRDTPFWREVAKPDRISPRLATLLDRWDDKPPSRLDFTDSTQLFAHINHEYILYGMGWTPRSMPPRLEGARPPERRLIANAETLGREKLMPHSKFLEKFVTGGRPRVDQAEK